MNKLLVLALCMMIGGCGIVIVDSTSEGKGGGTGGEAGSEETSSSSGTGGSETISSVTGSGGTGGSETTVSGSAGGTGGSGGEGGSMTTTSSTTSDKCSDEPDTAICFEACCNAPENPTMCIGNESGYCCPLDMFCIPKG